MIYVKDRMRTVYTPLDDTQKSLMAGIKGAAIEMEMQILNAHKYVQESSAPEDQKKAAEADFDNALNTLNIAKMLGVNGATTDLRP